MLQRSDTNADHFVPLLSRKLAARLKSIDGLVSLHRAASSETIHHADDARPGDSERTSKQMNPSNQPLARRAGAGRGGSPSTSK